MAAKLLSAVPVSPTERRLSGLADRRQGLIGWVAYSEHTGVVLHLHRSLATAHAALGALVKRFGVDFRILGLHSSGRAYEHCAGRATAWARTTTGVPITVPVCGRRLRGRGRLASVAGLR